MHIAKDSDGALSDEQRKAIEQADRWVLEALAELGAAYLQHREAQALYKKAQADLAACSAAAAEAEKQRAQILSVLAAELDLPPGKWIFGPEQGTLVKEETSNAEPT